MILTISIIRTHNFSARLIHIGGFLECVFAGKKPVKVYNHLEKRWGENTQGAIKGGVQTRNWDEYWNSLKNPECIDYEFELNEEQEKRFLEYVKHAEGKPYEYSMFLFHAKKIFTGKWSGRRDDDMLFCLEDGIRCLNQVFGFGLDPYMTPIPFKEWADRRKK